MTSADQAVERLPSALDRQRANALVVDKQRPLPYPLEAAPWIRSICANNAELRVALFPERSDRVSIFGKGTNP